MLTELGTDLCNRCHAQQAVFPCLEAFLLGKEFPSVYMIFYDFFLRAAVGEAQWKSKCLEYKEPTEELATPQLESFTMLLLKNNYFAWLLNEKNRLNDGNFVTDYDSIENRSGRKSYAEIMLKDMEVNLVDLPAGVEYVYHADEENNLLVSSAEPRYATLRAATMVRLSDVQARASLDESYEHLLSELESNESVLAIRPDDSNINADHVGEESSAEKKGKANRKNLKRFRVYTNPVGNEPKFKGWSARATGDQTRLMAAIESNIEMLKQFRAAYRLVYRMKNEGTGAKKRKSVEAPPSLDYKTQLWKVHAKQRIAI